MYIRGELVISKEDFKTINKENKYNNPRNLVAGLVNKYSYRLNKGEKVDTNDIQILSKIKFIGYDIIDNYNDKYETKLCMLNTIIYTTKYEIVTKKHINEKYLKEILILYKQKCEYEIDGLVLKYNDNIKEEDGRNPKFAVAFKNNNEGIETKIINIEWNVTKNNILKPRIQIEPVIIDGSKIEFTTGFNARYILNNNLGPDSIVSIIKSGDVIPYISNIIKYTTSQMPDQEWQWINDVDIKYIKQDAKQLFLKRMEYMFEIFEVKGIKMGNLERIYDYGIVNIIKLLEINKKDLLNIEGIKDKLADKFIEEILRIRKNMSDIGKLMVGSSIFPNFGEKKIEKIITSIPEILEYIKNNKIYVINEEEIEIKLNNIGIKKNAKDFLIYLNEFIEFYNSIEYLIIKQDIRNIQTKDIQVNIEIPIYLKNHSNICFSGFREKQLEQKLNLYNIKVSDTITKKVTLLVVKDINSDSKKKIEAEEKNIPIIDLYTFNKKIENN